MSGLLFLGAVTLWVLFVLGLVPLAAPLLVTGVLGGIVIVAVVIAGLAGAITSNKLKKHSKKHPSRPMGPRDYFLK
jgi:hypothetical protein